jgi:very-short-patch-repair endonuclease
MHDETAPDARLAALATTQHGVVSLAQLGAMGLDRDAVWRRAAAGRLHPLHRGVYAVGHTKIGREGRWLAAVLACGERAVLSHRSAAALWDLRATSAGRVDVTVPRASGRRSTRRIAVHRPRRAVETTVRDAIPVTTPMQTLAHLTPLLPRPALERALEAAERLDLLDVTRLPPRLRALVPGIDAALRSPLEARFLRLCRAHGLPQPRVNTRIDAYEVDFCWPEHRLVVETDGHRHHGTRAAFERDRARDAHLTALGWRVVRVTHRALEERPGEVVDLLRRLLSGRSRWPSTPG